MDKLVDAAVELVEGGKLGEAVAVLQQGIDVLAAAFPGRRGTRGDSAEKGRGAGPLPALIVRLMGVRTAVPRLACATGRLWPLDQPLCWLARAPLPTPPQP
jgi:hypothetical protein